MKAKTQLIIQTNSPGELSSWVTSVCETCKIHFPETEITLFLTPCQYATGQEKEKGKTLPLVKKVYSPKETIHHLLSWPWFSKPSKKGAILFLGGDPIYSQLLGLKHRFPVYGYTEGKKSLGLFFKHTFTQKEVGHLMADCLSSGAIDRSNILSRLQLEDKPYTLFFTSSRPKQFQALFPLLCQTIQEIRALKPEFYPIMNISPFITENQLEAAKKETDTTGILFFKVANHNPRHKHRRGCLHRTPNDSTNPIESS